MAKSNKTTRKELEKVVQKIIEELGFLRQTMIAIDNCLGAYIKFKGDTLLFNDFIKEQIDSMQKDMKSLKDEPESKDKRSAKESRYSKISTPPL